MIITEVNGGIIVYNLVEPSSFVHRLLPQRVYDGRKRGLIRGSHTGNVIRGRWKMIRYARKEHR